MTPDVALMLFLTCFAVAIPACVIVSMSLRFAARMRELDEAPTGRMLAVIEKRRVLERHRTEVLGSLYSRLLSQDMRGKLTRDLLSIDNELMKLAEEHDEN